MGPLISGKSRLVKYYNLARSMENHSFQLSCFVIYFMVSQRTEGKLSKITHTRTRIVDSPVDFFENLRPSQTMFLL